MFETIVELEDLLRYLELQSVLHEHGLAYRGSFLDDEYYWDESFTVLSELSEETVYMEATDSTLYLFRFSELHEFYTLCKEESRKIGVSFRKNPTVKEAEDFVSEILRSQNDYCFQWNIWTPKKLVKKRAYTFLIETGCEFYDYTNLIDAVLTIKEYYAEQCKNLLDKLSKPKIQPMPQRKERKAA